MCRRIALANAVDWVIHDVTLRVSQIDYKFRTTRLTLGETNNPHSFEYFPTVAHFSDVTILVSHPVIEKNVEAIVIFMAK